MLRAFKLYIGPDHASHVLEGTIDEKDRTDVVALLGRLTQQLTKDQYPVLLECAEALFERMEQ